MNKDMKKIAALVSTSLAASLSVGAANADANPFGIQELDGGYQIAQFLGEGKCGEGKCGEVK
ncbi:MAG: hypothetical protein HWE13_01230 [Gammaproteobacteria bacterium]|nr:hypothetical protein [Gammaproteobacteria bacterium]